MNTKKILFFSSILLMLSTASINVQAQNDAGEIKIICTNSILADFTKNIMPENTTVEYIMPPGVCPAYYDTKPSDVNKVIEADIIISFGNPHMEPWLSDLLEYNNDAEIIECKNLGEWNIPSGAIAHIELLTNELSEKIPHLNTTINQNSQDYINQINEKAEELQSIISSNNIQNKKVISMSWQKDFLEWLGLNVVKTYGPPQGLSAKDQIEIKDAATNKDTYAIIDNLQSGTDFGANIASETGKSHIIFTNFPGAIPGTDTYFEMIEYNTEKLVDGIQTYEYKRGDIADLEKQVSSIEMQRNIVTTIAGMFAILTMLLYVMYKRK